jgi:integrase-like protein
VLGVAEREGKVTPKDGAEPVAVSPFALAAVKLAIFTGARRGELLTLQWEHVDRERGVARVPEHKTDRGGAKTISLNASAVAILDRLPRMEGNPYVFPSVTRDGGHMVRVHDAWSAIRTAAGIEDVRLHDLRHSHASVGVSAGVSLPIVGKLLGHTVAQTTQRYAHVAPDPVREASELIGARLAAAMGPPRPDVTPPAPLRRGERVTLTAAARATAPGRGAGTVARQNREGFYLIRWDGRRTVEQWAPEMLLRAAGPAR